MLICLTDEIISGKTAAVGVNNQLMITHCHSPRFLYLQRPNRQVEWGYGGSHHPCIFKVLLNFLKDFIYSFMRDTERGRDTGRESSRLLVGNPMKDSILGPRDHDLDRQTLNR